MGQEQQHGEEQTSDRFFARRFSNLLNILNQVSPAAVSYLPDAYTVRVAVSAPGIYEAVAEASRRVSEAIRKCGLPGWPFCHVEVEGDS
jgi:hypothetical protein